MEQAQKRLSHCFTVAFHSWMFCKDAQHFLSLRQPLKLFFALGIVALFIFEFWMGFRLSWVHNTQLNPSFIIVVVINSCSFIESNDPLRIPRLQVFLEEKKM